MAAKDVSIIKVRVNLEEYKLIQQYAANAGLSISKLGKKAFLDAVHDSCLQADCIMRLIPNIYAKLDQIEDVSLRKELKKEVSQICQYLK